MHNIYTLRAVYSNIKQKVCDQSNQAFFASFTSNQSGPI